MSQFSPLLFSCFFWLVVFCSQSRAALTVREYDPARHDRFSAIDKQNFLGAAYDWSGVGHAGGPWATLVSPHYFLSATHFRPTIDSIVSFYSDNNAATVPYTAKVVSGVRIDNTDIWLGRLDTAVPVTSYAVALFPTIGHTIGQEVYTYGLAGGEYPAQLSMRLGRNVIDQFVDDFSDPKLDGVTDVIAYDYDEVGGVGGDEARVEGGDSGAPTFVIVNGQPALVGIHWFQYSQTNPVGSGSGDSFVPSYITSINAAMGNESLTVVSVPEPSSLTLLLLMMGGSGVWGTTMRRRSKRDSHKPS